MKTKLERFMAKVSIETDGCWRWSGAKNSNGYGIFHWGKKDATRDIPMVAHRAAWKLIRGEIPDHLMVRHLCNNAICCNPDHLQLGTHKENMEDRDKAGRTASGENHYFFKRRPPLLEAFKLLRSEGIGVDKICSILECGRNTFYRAIRNDPELQRINTAARSTMASQAIAQRIIDNPNLIKHGESNINAVLTSAKVRDIREKRRNGMGLKELAQEYGVTETSISNICNRKSWKHVI